jgi:hypothetical protein
MIQGTTISIIFKLKTMKTNIILASLATSIFALGLFTGCNDEDEFKEVSVTPVERFYEPENEKYTILQPSGSMYFEWEKAYAEDNSVVYYEVLFDTQDGDFSEPVYIVTSDNKGLSNGATISHKILNNIAAMAGIELGQEGVLKWTVRSNRGLNFQLAEENRTITIIRLNSIDDLEGAELFVSGEGSEEGQQVKATEDMGVYEIYTRLEANQPYYFYSELGETQRTFEVNADKVSFRETFDTPEGTSVSETGVYRITLDFGSASAKVERINSLEIFVSWTQRRTELVYVAEGVWKIEDYNVQLAATDWGFDERYKFIFVMEGAEQHFGQYGPYFDSRPGINREGYRDMKPTGDGQWGGDPFKFPEELCDGADLDRYFTDITVYMTADGNYTHEFTNISE